MNIAIVGSRGITDYELVSRIAFQTICGIPMDRGEITIVSGGARGVDRLAERFAKEYNYYLLVIPAQWDKYQNRAGFVRNEEVVKASDLIIAIWDGKSPGTKSTIALAKQYEVPCIVELFSDAKPKLNSLYFDPEDTNETTIPVDE